jgi:hypothetical protein
VFFIEFRLMCTFAGVTIQFANIPNLRNSIDLYFTQWHTVHGTEYAAYSFIVLDLPIAPHSGAKSEEFWNLMLYRISVPIGLHNQYNLRA